MLHVLCCRFSSVVLQCGRVSSLENLKSLNKILFKLLFT